MNNGRIYMEDGDKVRLVCLCKQFETKQKKILLN